MKKSDLIKLLEEIPDDTEILFYNGFVEDWHEIEIEKSELCKPKEDIHKRLVVLEKYFNAKVEYPDEETIQEQMKSVADFEFDWEFNGYATEDTHEFKEVFLICGKERGKDSFDRLGTMCY